MTIHEKREVVSKVYPSTKWKIHVYAMPEDQIIALYNDFAQRRMLDGVPGYKNKTGVDRLTECKDESIVEAFDEAINGPKQLGIFDIERTENEHQVLYSAKINTTKDSIDALRYLFDKCQIDYFDDKTRLINKFKDQLPSFANHVKEYRLYDLNTLIIKFNDDIEYVFDTITYDVPWFTTLSYYLSRKIKQAELDIIPFDTTVALGKDYHILSVDICMDQYGNGKPYIAPVAQVAKKEDTDDEQ